MQRQHFSAQMADAFDAAEQALQERFKIEVREPGRGYLKTAAVLTSAPRKATVLDSKLRSKRAVRKSVEIRIEPEGDGVVVGCRASIEENQSGAHRMYQRSHTISDIPSDTPAERGAASTPEQDAVWKTVGRDKALERQIYRAITEILAK